jgi:hypothetical protein
VTEKFGYSRCLFVQLIIVHIWILLLIIWGFLLLGFCDGRAEFHSFVEGFLEKTVSLYLIQNHLEALLALIGNFEIDQGFVDKNQFMFHNVHSSCISLAFFGFHNLYLVRVVVSKEGVLLAGLISRFRALRCGLEYLYPVIDTHTVSHVVGESLVVRLKLFFFEQGL